MSVKLVGESGKASSKQAAAADPAQLVVASNEISLIVLCLSCVAIAYAFPFPVMKYALALLFGVVLLAQTMRRPAIGLAMVAFAAPASDLIPTSLIPIPAINAETLMIFFTLFVWARANRLQGKEEISSPTSRVLVVYALLIAASAVHSWMVWHASLFSIFAWAKNHLSYLIFLPVSFHVLRDRRDQVIVLVACTASLFLNSLSAIDHSFMAFVGGNLERHRASALLATQPNIFGGAMALYLPMTLVLATNNLRSRFLNLWFVGGSALVAFALMLTLSRGAWVAAAGGLAAVAVFKARKLLLVMLVAAAFYQLWVPEQAIDRVRATTSGAHELAANQVVDDSTQMRVEQYKSLPSMMARSPLIGSGYKSYSEMFRRFGTLGRAKGAHSSFCQIGVEEGVVGLVVLLLIFISLIRSGVSAARILEDPLHIWLGVGIVGATVSMILCMASGARFEAQRVFYYFWIMVGIVERELVLARAKAGEHRSRPSPVAPSAGSVER